jgi:hypothetical protein
MIGLTQPPQSGQALAALRSELALRGVAAEEMILTRLGGRLTPSGSPAIGYAYGWFLWPAGRISRSGRPLYAIHAAHDPAGAARRITKGRTGPSPGDTDKVGAHSTRSDA